MKVALFGGAFDPIHLGHLTIAQYALKAFALDQVRLIPCKIPVHKNPCQVGRWHRAAMIALAICNEANLYLDTSELLRHTPSYAIDTITQYQALYPAHQLYWLLGQDALSDFFHWHRWQDIISKVDLIVVKRSGLTLDVVAEGRLIAALKQHNHQLHYLNMPLQAEASRIIRKDQAFEAVPLTVKAYIEELGLYR